jgi:hypothetical protein
MKILMAFTIAAALGSTACEQPATTAGWVLWQLHQARSSGAFPTDTWTAMAGYDSRAACVAAAFEPAKLEAKPIIDTGQACFPASVDPRGR